MSLGDKPQEPHTRRENGGFRVDQDAPGFYWYCVFW